MLNHLISAVLVLKKRKYISFQPYSMPTCNKTPSRNAKMSLVKTCQNKKQQKKSNYHGFFQWALANDIHPS